MLKLLMDPEETTQKVIAIQAAMKKEEYAEDALQEHDLPCLFIVHSVRIFTKMLPWEIRVLHQWAEKHRCLAVRCNMRVMTQEATADAAAQFEDRVEYLVHISMSSSELGLEDDAMAE